MQYRREIDGLRAVAVLPVTLFHAGFSAFSGGFVGVDVFFVISGYLITSILAEDIERGRFSILHFYERRARRILPALFFVVAACVPFAWLWMFPAQMEEFGHSLVAVALFVSNVLFWQESDYFAEASDEKPLLHTWSLAVEEQYYLLFPIFLFFAWRFGKRWAFWSIVAIAGVSLLCSEWGWRNNPTANFYLPISRAWELFAGSICAFVIRDHGVRANQLLAALGLAAILASIFLFDEATPFPSLYALLPVAGTAAIILFAEQRTVVARLLGLRPFVGIGLISYSAYLWHQPLFAFARIRSLYEPSAMLFLALGLLSLALAVVSWRFVEQPFRDRRSGIVTRRGTVFALSLAGMAAMIAAGLYFASGGGLPQRFDRRVLAVYAAKDATYDLSCYFDENKPLEIPLEQCRGGPADASRKVLLMGDSHSLALEGEVVAALNRAGYGTYRVSYSGCPPFAGLRRFDKGLNHRCPQFVDEVLDFAQADGIDTLVITGRMTVYLWGSLFDNGEGGIENGNAGFVDDASRSASAGDDPQRRERVLSLAENDIRQLSRRFRVVLVAPIPAAGWDLPEFQAKRMLFGAGAPGEVTTDYARYRERAAPILDLYRRLAAQSDRIVVAPVHQALCDEATSRCRNTQAGRLLYRDDNHPSAAGAALVAPIIVQAVEKVSPALPRQ